MSWDNFKESGNLKAQVEVFKTYTEYYAKLVYTERICRTRKNRAWCKGRGIRISGTTLGSSPTIVSKETKKEAWEDDKVRNSIEGKLGTCGKENLA